MQASNPRIVHRIIRLELSSHTLLWFSLSHDSVKRHPAAAEKLRRVFAVADVDRQDLVGQVLGELHMLLGVLGGHGVDFELVLDATLKYFVEGRLCLIVEQSHEFTINEVVLSR